MADFHKSVVVLAVVLHVFVTTTEAQWPTHYPAHESNTRYIPTQAPQSTHKNYNFFFYQSNTPVRSPFQTLSPIQRYLSPTQIPVQRHFSTQIPVQRHFSTQIPVQRHFSTQIPVQRHFSTQIPVQRHFSTQIPVQRHFSTQIPVQRHFSTQIPVQRHFSTQIPVQRHFSTQIPVQRHFSTQIPVQRHFSTQIPVQRHFSTQIPVQRHFSTRIPVQRRNYYLTRPNIQSFHSSSLSYPLHYSTLQPSRTQQHATHTTLHYLEAQQPVRNPKSWITTSQHNGHQLVSSQQPAHNRTHQSVSLQPIYKSIHLLQIPNTGLNHSYEPINPLIPAYNPSYQSVSPHQPAQSPSKKGIILQQPTQQPAWMQQLVQSSDRRYQSTRYWHPNYIRYQQHWPQDAQISHKPKYGEERFDKERILFKEVNTEASTIEPALGTLTTTNRPINTHITASTNSTTEGSTEVTTKANNSFSSQSIPISTILASSITSTISPSRLDITTTEIPVTTIISTTSFLLAPTTYSINYLRTAINNTTVPPPPEIYITNATATHPKIQPFTMKPVHVIFKTEKHENILLNPLPANHTENLSKHVNENADLVSTKICCEDKHQEHTPGKEMQNITDNTQAAITMLPHINSEDKNNTDEQLINHDDKTFPSPGKDNGESSHGSPLMLNGVSNISTLIKGNNSNSTLINLERIPSKFTESHSLLSSQLINNNTSPQFVTEKMPTPHVQQRNESLQQYQDIPPTPGKATRANDFKQNIDESSQEDKDISPPPVEETTLSLVEQIQEYSHPSDRVRVTPKPINIIKVAERPQTAKIRSTSRLPLKESLQFSNKMDNEKVILLPITSPSTSQGVNGHSNHPLQSQVRPKRLLVPRPSLRHPFRSRIIRKNLENHPSSKPQPVHTDSSHGTLPQFNPASGLEFKLLKNIEEKSESRNTNILPQFSPSSGLKFILAHPDNGSNTEFNSNDKENGVSLHPDPSQIVSGSSFSSPLLNKTHNPHVAKETNRQKEGNIHHESDKMPQIYEKDKILSIQNSSNLTTTTGGKINEQPLSNVTDKGNTSVSETVQIIPATVLFDVNDIPYTTTVSPFSVQTLRSEVAGEIMQTIASFTDSHEVEGNSSLEFTTSSGFLLDNKESQRKPLSQNGKNQSVTFEEIRDKESHLLHLKRNEFTKPKQLEANKTANSENYGELERGNTPVEQMKLPVAENTNVLPPLPLLHSAMPSTTDTNSEAQQTPTKFLNLGLSYKEVSTFKLSSIRSDIESNKSHNMDEFKTVPSSQTHQNVTSSLSHKEFHASQRPQHLPFIQLSTPLLSSDFPVSPLTVPSWHPLFDQQTSNQSYLLDTLQVKQFTEEEDYEKPSSTSVSSFQNVTSTITMAPEAKAYTLSSSVTGDYDKLASDILEALPHFLKGSVKVDRTNLARHNNVVISDSYGNVVYQQRRTTFSDVENDL